MLYGISFYLCDFLWFLKKNGNFNFKHIAIIDKKISSADENILGFRGINPERVDIKNSDVNADELISIIMASLKKNVKEICTILEEKGIKNIVHFSEIKPYIDYIKEQSSLPINKSFNKIASQIDINKTNGSKTAIILHAFHLDIVDEIFGYLNNIYEPFDLYISFPENKRGCEDEFIKKTKNLPFCVNYKIYFFENRGRDILPFLRILRDIDLNKYNQILKVHTKKSSVLDRNIYNYRLLEQIFWDGYTWRRILLNRLIGSPKNFENIKKLFRHKSVGIVAPVGFLFPLRYYSVNIERRIKYLNDMVGFKGNIKNVYFFAGSMFWFNPKIFSEMRNIDIEKIKFEEELGQKDGTWAHIFERFFGVLPILTNKKIFMMDNNGEVYSIDKYKKVDLETFTKGKLQ